MSKPLILTIHPRLEDANLSPEDIRQGRWTELRLRNRKRLTDTELAAEYHKDQPAPVQDAVQRSILR
jgi:hypothetical protein